MHLRTRLERIGLSAAMALPEPAQRALAGRPSRIDGNTLATDCPADAQAAAAGPAARRRGAAARRGPRGAAHHHRAHGRRPADRLGAVARVADLPARLYLPEGAPPVGPLLVFFHGGGLLVRRPRQPRRDLPVPRRAGRGAGAVRGLPARPRAPVPRGARRRRGGLRLDCGARRRARAPTRPGSASAATRPAATSRRAWRSRRPGTAGRARSSCSSTQPRRLGARPGVPSCSRGAST